MAKMLVGAGADVNAMEGNHRTPVQIAITHEAIECAEVLLWAGARVSTVKFGLGRRPWIVAMVAKRKQCCQSCLALYGVLRKRWRLSDGQRVPRDMITLLTRLLWQSWLRAEITSKTSDN